MKNIAIAFIVVLAYMTGCCSALPLRESGPTTQEEKINFIQHLDRGTAVLLLLKDQEYRPFCSSVWVDTHLLLTARHCVIDDDLAEIKKILGLPPNYQDYIGNVVEFGIYQERDKIVTGKTQAHKAKVVAVDHNYDLALLETAENLDHDIINVSRELPWTGQSVHIVGHTIGLVYNYTPGIVSYPKRDLSKFFPLEKNKQVLHLTALIAPGNSGGGAFNDRGELIGICSFTALRAPGSAFFVHLDEITKFLESYR